MKLEDRWVNKFRIENQNNYNYNFRYNIYSYRDKLIFIAQ